MMHIGIVHNCDVTQENTLKVSCKHRAGGWLNHNVVWCLCGKDEFVFWMVVIVHTEVIKVKNKYLLGLYRLNCYL